MKENQFNKFILYVLLVGLLFHVLPGHSVKAALPIMDGDLIEADELTLSALELVQAINLAGPWSPVYGNLTEGFALVLDPGTEYTYLDVASLSASEALVDGVYPFYLDTSNLPADFYAYWEGRGVYAGCAGTWEPTMWQIINGIAPMFYLKVVGTSYDLVDGLQYQVSISLDPENPVEEPLRINGAYPLGDYAFNGTIVGESTLMAEITVDMHFTAALTLDGLTLLESEDGLSGWTAVYGDLQDGFTMLLTEDTDTFEYLDVDALVVNNPLEDGLYPFTLDISDLPTGYYDYWAAKGVDSGATGWQGVMWQIINGAAPMFYLKVDGTSYDLIDGLQYQVSISLDPENPVESPLRISEDYPLGTYGFDGQLTDIYDTSTAVTVQITFIDGPLAIDQSVKTYIETSLAIELEAIGDGTIKWWRTDPPNGNITGSSPNITYTPDAGFTGSDSFTFYIDDDIGSSNVASVDIMVYNRPSIDSDNLGDAFLINENQAFNVRLQNPSDGDTFTNVLVKFRLENASQSDITSFEYYETSTSEWLPMPLVEEADDLIGYFGPIEGFPMGLDYDATSQFRVTFASLGDFPATIGVYDLGTEPDTLLTSYSTTVRVTVPFEVTDIDLRFAEDNDPEDWDPVPSSSAFVFEMRLDQTMPWYYIDATLLTSNRPVEDGFYPFFLDVDSLPIGFYAYWAGRHVDENATDGWEALMWQIINANAPIFYLDVIDGDLMLVDGLLYAIDGSKAYLRFEGDYWPGIYTFEGAVADDYGLEKLLSVEMMLNDRPLTTPQSLTTSEDVPLEFDLDVVDYYPGTITFKYTDFPDDGELILTNAPTIIYIPDENFHGTDSFSYRAFDGIAYSKFTTVTITVTPVNDAPEAFDGTYYTAINTAINIVLETNDVEGDPLTYSYPELPDNGGIGGTEPNLVYTPNLDFVGWDSFIFEVTDGEYTDSATIRIHVGPFENFLPLIVN